MSQNYKTSTLSFYITSCTTTESIFVNDEVQNNPNIPFCAWCFFRHFGFSVTHLSSCFHFNSQSFYIPQGWIGKTKQPFNIGMIDEHMWTGFSWIEINDPSSLDLTNYHFNNTSPFSNQFEFIGVWKNSLNQYRIGICCGLNTTLFNNINVDIFTQLAKKSQQKRKRILTPYSSSTNLEKIEDYSFNEINLIDNNELEMKSWVSTYLSFHKKTFNIYIYNQTSIYDVFVHQEPQDCTVWKTIFLKIKPQFKTSFRS